jgi:hypothetical protein
MFQKITQMLSCVRSASDASHFCSPHPKSLSQGGRGTLNLVLPFSHHFGRRGWGMRATLQNWDALSASALFFLLAEGDVGQSNPKLGAGLTLLKLHLRLRGSQSRSLTTNIYQLIKIEGKPWVYQESFLLLCSSLLN